MAEEVVHSQQLAEVVVAEIPPVVGEVPAILEEVEEVLRVARMALEGPLKIKGPAKPRSQHGRS